MTESDSAPTPGIDDDQLPEDLRPTEDNPLAQPLDPEDPNVRSPEELGLRETSGDRDGDGESDAAR